jgi:glycosyltransferase involved in cell wall biosynthesis
MKVSIIMPTYNDEDTICESLDSVRLQSYSNYELIIINDGSTDNTEYVVKSYIKEHRCEERFHYYSQENADQLSAIWNTLQYATGDYIYILHSDDLLYNEKSLEFFDSFERKNPGYDAYTGDEVIINAEGKQVQYEHVMKYRNKKKRLALMYLWLGRNLYSDIAFFSKQALKKVGYSYLTWNMPYWFCPENKTGCLNVKSMDFPIFRYRIYTKNYINNALGKLNVINGELRTLTSLMKYFWIPCYRTQYFLFRICNKLNLSENFYPLYFCTEEHNKGKVIRFAIKKRFSKSYRKNVFLNSLFNFYSSNSSREIFLPKLDQSMPIYLGRDMRKFNNKLMKGTLEPFYYYLMNEMRKGFHIVHCFPEDVESVSNILQFLCIKEFTVIKSENI